MRTPPPLTSCEVYRSRVGGWRRFAGARRRLAPLAEDPSRCSQRTPTLTGPSLGDRDRGELDAVQLGIDAAAREQFCVSSLLDDATGVEHGDAIDALDRR